MLTIYTLSNCDTCRAATKWLKSRGIEFEERAIRDTPPTRAELRRMLTAYEGDLKKIFNTAGRDYREQGMGEKLRAMNPAAAVELLAANGNLVKRPFLIGDKVSLVGFNADTWSEALGSK